MLSTPNESRAFWLGRVSDAAIASDYAELRVPLGTQSHLKYRNQVFTHGSGS
jgi:hypothetical protein